VKRVLIYSTFVIAALVSGRIARAHFLRSTSLATSQAGTRSGGVGSEGKPARGTGLAPVLGISEPASLLLLGAGLFSLSEVRRRSERRAQLRR
jgi:hypothetical protein